MSKLKIYYFTRKGNNRTVGMASCKCGKHTCIVNDVSPKVIYSKKTKEEIKVINSLDITDEKKLILGSELVSVIWDCYIKTKEKILGTKEFEKFQNMILKNNSLISLNDIKVEHKYGFFNCFKGFVFYRQTGKENSIIVNKKHISFIDNYNKQYAYYIWEDKKLIDAYTLQTIDTITL